MNKKYILLPILAASITITIIYFIRKKDNVKKENVEAVQSPSIVPIVKEEPIPKTTEEKPEPPYLGCKKSIEGLAKTIVKDYDQLSPEANAHLIAEILVIEFIRHSLDLIERSEIHHEFPLHQKPRGIALELLWRKFIKSEGGLIEKAVIENDCNDISRLQTSKDPVYNIFSELNKETDSVSLMRCVGIEGTLTCKDLPLRNSALRDLNKLSEKRHRQYPMLDINETYDRSEEKTTFEEYLKKIILPVPELPDANCYYVYDETVPREIEKYFKVMIFYYDSCLGPEINMPSCIDIQSKHNRGDRAFTYELASVIIAEGYVDDVHKMKVLHRPDENVEDYVKVANEKGCYFLYKIRSPGRW
ncbi:hypothetical protein ENBRE01_0342 [Enteropsectra breve]|nr:hypothetical protein ENBRE01_0342 [Enteropsectra breve]